MNAEKVAPKMILESNWTTEADMQNCLSLQERGSSHSTPSLVSEDDFVSVQSSVLLTNEALKASSGSNGASSPPSSTTTSSSSSPLPAFELRLIVPEDDCFFTGFSVVSEVPMFEVYAGVHSEYLGTFGGYVMDETLDIVSYRVDIEPQIKIRDKTVLKFSPKAGRHSLWVFGLVVLYEKLSPEVANVGPIDLNHVVNLVANARKPASETDMSLMTKLCEIFNSSMSAVGGAGDRLLRQKSKESVGQLLSAVAQNCAPKGGAEAATKSQHSASVNDFDAFKEKIEATLSEHSQKLAAFTEAFLSKNRSAAAFGDHEPLQIDAGSLLSTTSPPASIVPYESKSRETSAVADELKAFQNEVRQSLQSMDRKLDVILDLLQGNVKSSD